MTANQQPPPIPAPIIFLDTNAVHFATLALSFGSKYTFDVVAETSANMKAALQAKGITAWDRYVYGARIVRYLCRRFEEEAAELYYSPVTGLEILCGGLRGEAVKRAAQIGVPNRWFSRMEEEEIRVCLEPDGYAQVQVYQSDVAQRFDSVGLILTEHKTGADVWSLARALMENVFVDVQDCLVYASALIAQATELITADGYLCNTVRWTKNPGSAPAKFAARFTSVRMAILSTCAAILGWTVDNVAIPVQVGKADINQFLNEANP